MKSLTLQLTDDGYDAVVRLQAHFQLAEPQEVFIYALGMLDLAVTDKKSKNEKK